MTKYQNNSLNTVIFRVDFVSPISIDDNELIKSCLSIYPVVQEETVNDHNVQTSLNEKGEISINRSTTTYPNKKFSNRQLTRYISLSPRFVLTEVKDYTSYEDIRETFINVFEAITVVNPDVTIARIGMRYINSIDLTNYKRTARKQYVKNSLFANPYEEAIIESDQARTQHLVELVIEDYRVRCVTGLFNPDYPAAIKRYEVTLDFDAFIQGDVASKEVLSYLDKFHKTIKALYEESILTKQRKNMGILEEE